ncbi:Chitin synthase 4 [Coniosporium apollinis]|uniref:Chitin synthase 4 n=1 Tax=Coniosporium apollinis TaxID=61459 RepID=A0ABQ9P3W2_9PEZI|nr:Chitin synthase 4 [Coniosporium apollinis]
MLPPRTVSLTAPVYIHEKEDVQPTLPPLPFSRRPPYDSRQPSITLSEAPQNNAHVDSLPGYVQKRPAPQSIHSSPPSSRTWSRTESRDLETPEPDYSRASTSSLPVTHTIPFRQREIKRVSDASHHSQVAEVSTAESSSYRNSATSAVDAETESTEGTHYSDEPPSPAEVYPALQYHHQPFSDSPRKPAQEDNNSSKSDSQTSSNGNAGSSGQSGSSALLSAQTTLPRPSSAYTLGSELNNARGRTQSPHLAANGQRHLSPSPSGSPLSHARPGSAQRRSPESRPISYIDLLNTPYQQQAPAATNFDNTFLRSNVGTNASLLDPKKTLEMYRLNVKKTNDPAIQYEFAVFMVNMAKTMRRTSHPSPSPSPNPQAEMLREARSILQRLADRAYPFAQYYLGDGYASGLFNKGKEDWDRAFPLFVAASKHGHAEAGYRAGLCYEFGWGCRKDYAKAVQFYRASASKNHPGAATRLGKACLTGDMGLGKRYREGLKWLKRAAESADTQYRDAPYELGLLHQTGFGEDVFKDEAYAAQLFTQAAELGHELASLKMGEAYEHGLLACPRDPALSVHFYNGAAQAGIPEAMMNLCAWYMVGAEPVLEKDECEAYEWAKKAAEMGLPKAEYAVGYFTEMGIGCRRDPLEANVWYVRAADQGDERAKQRLAIIRAAVSGEGAGIPMAVDKAKSKKGGGDKDCIVM